MRLVPLVKNLVPPLLWSGARRLYRAAVGPVEPVPPSVASVHRMFGDDGLTLDIGCGPDPKADRAPALRNAIGIDYFFPENADLVFDIAAYPLPFREGTVRTIYSGHCFEHFPPDTLTGILQECLRVLEPGGALRISMPHLRVLAEAYLKGDAAYYESFSARGATLGDRFNYLLRAHGHHWIYDPESFALRLREAGFRDVAERPYDPDWDYREAPELRMRAVRPEAPRPGS